MLYAKDVDGSGQASTYKREIRWVLRRRGDGGAAGAGVQAGGGDILLPVAQMKIEVLEAAPQNGLEAVRGGLWPQ
jgi:hypothetical protein